MSRPTNNGECQVCGQRGVHECFTKAHEVVSFRIAGHTSVGPPDLAQRLIAAGVQPSPLPDPLPEGLVIVDDPEVPQTPDFDTTGLVFDGFGWIPDPWADFVDDDAPPMDTARPEVDHTRPERPCTYDPADEEPEAEPVLVMSPANAVRFKQEIRSAVAHPDTYANRLLAGLAPVVRHTPPEDPGTFPGVGHWPDWTPPRPAAVEYFDFPAVAPQGGPAWMDSATWFRREQHRTAREANVIAESIGWPKVVLYDLSGRVLNPDDVKNAPPFKCGCGAQVRWSVVNSEALAVDPDGTPHTCSTVEPPGWSDGAEVTTYPCPVCGDMFDACDCDQSAAHLRSCLRTLTNPDATPQDVVDALAALTPEDRALVTAPIPSARPTPNED